MLAKAIVLCLALWVASPVSSFYIPGTYPKEFSQGDQLDVQVNSLVSYDTELPFEYYSLPVCRPAEGIVRAKNTVNPGTILAGARIYNSPYHFKMNVEEKGLNACGEEKKNAFGPLSKRDVRTLKQRINQNYYIRFILDNLPVSTFELEKPLGPVLPGVEVGHKQDGKYYVHNHMNFIVLIHKTHGEFSNQQAAAMQADLAAGRKLLQDAAAGGDASATPTATEKWMIVGFEVVPCSIKRDPKGPIRTDLNCGKDGDPERQEVVEGAEIVYTYDVYFRESPVDWASRWNAYLTMPGGKVHWFSLVNSLLVLLVMAVIAAMILMRTVRRDLQKYEELLVEGGKSDLQDESGWKMVGGDVFRPPAHAERLAVQAGSGIQILTTSGATIFLGMLGFLSPASRGALITMLIVLYLLLAIVAGFVTTWLWTYIQQEHVSWSRICFKVACYFPGVTGLVLAILNVALHTSQTTGAIPLGTFFKLFALWFVISIPLSYVGGFFAARWQPVKQPSRTNQIPRHIPPPPLAAHPIILFLAAGLLPFGTIFVELRFAMASLWQGLFYYLFGFLFLVAVLTVIITAEVSILCTYVQLCAEDHQWWWRSFQRGGSVALYVGLYALVYFFTTLHKLSGFLSALMYFSYMTVIVLGLYLAMGATGFFTSLLFTHAIFASIKAD